MPNLQDELTKIYNNEENKQVLADLASAENISVYSENGTFLPIEPEKKDQTIMTYLLKYGSLYYIENSPAKNKTAIHLLALKDTQLEDSVITPELYKIRLGSKITSEISSYHINNYLNIYPDNEIEYDLILDERSKTGNSILKIQNEVSGLSELLSSCTQKRRSSKEYKNVEKAISDFISVRDKLTAAECQTMLFSIADLANIWLSNRPAPDEKTSEYKKNRYHAMNDVYFKAYSMASALSFMADTGMTVSDRINPPGAEYKDNNYNFNSEDAEKCMQAARRSMRGNEFNKNSFALWKAMTSLTEGKEADQIQISQNDRNRMIRKILASPAMNIISKFTEACDKKAKEIDNSAYSDAAVIKDEHEADRVYKAAQEAQNIISRLRKTSDKNLEKTYTDILNNSKKSILSGKASFDTYLRDYVLDEMRKEMYIRGFVLDYNERIISSETGPALTSKHRLMMLHSLFDEAIGTKLANKQNNDNPLDLTTRPFGFDLISNINIQMKKAVSDTDNLLAKSVFDMDYKDMAGLFGNKIDKTYGIKERPGTILTAILMTEPPLGGGLTMEEIFDSAAKTEEKRKIGRLIQEDFEKPAADRVYTKDKIDRILIDQAKKMNDYLLEMNEHISTNTPGSLEMYSKKTGPLSEGLYEMTQILSSSKMWTADRARSLAAFRHDNESDQEVMERVNLTLETLNYQRSYINKEDDLIKDYCTIGDLLHRQQMDDTARGNIKNSIIKAFEHKFVSEAIRSLPPAENAEEAENYKLVMSYVGPLLASKLVNNVLSECSDYEKLIMLTSHGMFEKISIHFKPDELKKCSRENLLSMAEDGSLYNLADIDLRLEYGLRKHTISNDLINGKKTSEEEKQFMNRFFHEMTVLSKQGAQTSYVLVTESLEKLAQKYLPEEMNRLQELFTTYTDEFNELYDIFSFNDKSFAKAGYKDIDQMQYILIGNQTAEKVLQETAAKRFHVDYDELDKNARILLLTAVSATAMKHGQNVSMISVNPNASGKNETKLSKTTLKLPFGLTGKLYDKDCVNIMSALWKDQKNLHADKNMIVPDQALKLQEAFRRLDGKKGADNALPANEANNELPANEANNELPVKEAPNVFPAK